MSKTKKQLRADAVERLRNHERGIRLDADLLSDELRERMRKNGLSPDEWRDALIDLLTDDDANDDSAPESGVSDPDGGSNVAYIASDSREKSGKAVFVDGVQVFPPKELEHMADSREKLEADVRKHYAYTTTTLMYPPSANKSTDMLRALPVDTVIGWLDRQAAITKRETLHDNPTCSGRSTCAANRSISESADRETPETVEIGASKDEIRDFDVWSVAYEIYCAGGYVDNGNEPNPPTDGIRELLDRQAAIKERECEELVCAQAERIAEVAAERDAFEDELRAVNRLLKTERGNNKVTLNNWEQAKGKLQRQREELDRRARQLDARDEMTADEVAAGKVAYWKGQAEKAREQAEGFRERLSRAIGLADEIASLR